MDNQDKSSATVPMSSATATTATATAVTTVPASGGRKAKTEAPAPETTAAPASAPAAPAADPVMAEILDRLRLAEAQNEALRARIEQVEASAPAAPPSAPVKPLAPGHLRVRFNAIDPVDTRRIHAGPRYPGLHETLVFSRETGFEADVPESVAQVLCHPKRTIAFKDQRGKQVERPEFVVVPVGAAS